MIYNSLCHILQLDLLEETKDGYNSNRQKLEQMGTVIWNKTTEQFGVMEFSEKFGMWMFASPVRGFPKLDKEILENAEKLRPIAHTGGSVATLVSDFLYERGIKVISGNEINAESVAEGMIGYALASLKIFRSMIVR